MPGSEQAALLPLPIVRDAIRPRSLPFDFVRIGSHVHHNRQTNHQVRHATFTLTFLTFT